MWWLWWLCAVVCCCCVLLLCCCSEAATSVCMSTAPQSLIGRASTPKRRPKEAEKIRRKKHASTGVSHVKLEKIVQFSKCELRGAKLQPKASTGHSAPFKPNGEETHQDSSLPHRRKCVKYVHSQSTEAEHVSTVEPSIASHEESRIPKNQISALLSNTQTPGTMTAKQGQKEIMHKMPSANNACTRDRKFFQKQP